MANIAKAGEGSQVTEGLFEKLITNTGRIISRLSPLKFFIITASIFGIAFLLITPPFQTPDEDVHFYRTYQLSQFNFIVDPINGGGYGGVLPSSLGRTILLTTTKPTISFNDNVKYSERKTLDALKIPLNPRQTSTYNFASTGGYSPIAYIPQVAGMLIGRLLSLPPIILMYLARFGNLCAWIILIGLSIRLIPQKKWVMVFIGLLPMALFQAVSESADIMAIGLAAVFFTYILYLIDKNKVITYKKLLILLITGMALVLTKEIMFVFLFLLLLLPWRLFESKKRAFMLKTVLILIPIMLFFIWTYITRHIVTAAAVESGVNPREQMKFLLRSPYSFINVLWNTYFFTWGDNTTRSLIGSFGWDDAPLAAWIVVVGYIGYLFTCIVSTGGRLKAWLDKKQKTVLLLIILGYWLAVNAAIYVYYSPVGFKIIYGMQGRYFIPILFLMIPLLIGNWLKTDKRIYQRIAIYVPIFLLVASVITIYVRYFIHNV
jgi:uncharacterized membrane protein